eukprot:s637_g17.t2
MVSAWEYPTCTKGLYRSLTITAKWFAFSTAFAFCWEDLNLVVQQMNQLFTEVLQNADRSRRAAGLPSVVASQDRAVCQCHKCKFAVLRNRQDLAEAWIPWDESLGLGFQYGLAIGDQSLYRRCALQFCDLPFQPVVTMSDPPHDPLADVSLWLLWPPMSDPLYQVNAVTNGVRELETNLSREHHARGNLEQAVATLRGDQAILIESICASTPALAARFGNWR